MQSPLAQRRGVIQSAFVIFEEHMFALVGTESSPWLLLALGLAAYFLGSIPSGFLVAKICGVDIRGVGSGNIGATNAFRVLGRTAGTIVLLYDALKGFAAVRWLPLLFHGASPEYAPMVGGFCAILGHNYTCWLKFKGGKGIATSAGVMLALAPLGLAIILSTWLIIFYLSGYVSLASIAAAAVLPFGVWLTGSPRPVVILTAVVGALAIYKHRPNIKRLMNGTENRFGKRDKKKSA